MFCSKCGTQNVNGEQFCKNCGTILNNNQQSTNQGQYSNNQMYSQQSTNQGQYSNNQMYNQQSMNQGQYSNNQMYNQQPQNNNGNLNNNYVNQAVNPNMKKWVILSVIIPIAGMIWYWFIGLSVYLAIFIAACGFGFAQKGEMANKKLATAGKVLNGVLCGMAIIMLILQIIEIFA